MLYTVLRLVCKLLEPFRSTFVIGLFGQRASMYCKVENNTWKKSEHAPLTDLKKFWKIKSVDHCLCRIVCNKATLATYKSQVQVRWAQTQKQWVNVWLRFCWQLAKSVSFYKTQKPLAAFSIPSNWALPDMCMHGHASFHMFQTN